MLLRAIEVQSAISTNMLVWVAKKHEVFFAISPYANALSGLWNQTFLKTPVRVKIFRNWMQLLLCRLRNRRLWLVMLECALLSPLFDVRLCHLLCLHEVSLCNGGLSQNIPANHHSNRAYNMCTDKRNSLPIILLNRGVKMQNYVVVYYNVVGLPEPVITLFFFFQASDWPTWLYN